jgi:hypothetical protein
MSLTLGALLEARAGALAGREPERARLHALLEPGGPVAGYLHGLAGVGKSTLLHAFAADARAAGAVTVELDAHSMYATHRSFLATVAGRDEELEIAEVAAALGERGETVVLLIDSFELLIMIDRWICREFIPALPANVRVAVAGRNVPAERWRAYGPLLCAVPLGNLDPDDAAELLRENGVEERLWARVNSICRGHPLSLQLAAWALRDRPGLALDAIAAGPVAEELARVYLDGLDGPTRRALDAAALTRRTTLSLLEAMLPDDDPAAAFARLRALPFAELDADGLLVHDTVREATSALLRAADPQAYWRMRTAAWGRLRTELRGARPRDLRRYTADMLYLIEEDAVRDVFFPATVGEQQVSAARPSDLDAMAALAPDFEHLRDWWEAVPEAFIVARCGHDGTVAGFAILAEPHTVSPRLLDRDALAGAWRAHLRRDAPPRGQKTLFLRRLVAPYGSAGQAALLIEVTRRYFELRPELRRVYATSDDFIGADASCALVMGYLPLPDVPGTVCVDFGASSVDGWLAELGARQQLAAEDGAVQVDGLTKLEAEVLAYLQRHEGRPVERAALLRDVWGYDWTGGSNVVEVVVSSLRRKLGDRAAALETVRGVGYRIGPL